MPIRHFLLERISTFQKDEDVPRKIILLAEAIEDEDDKEEDDEEETADLEGGGPYGTILHTASVVGNDWLVEIQIKASVDVTTFDGHSWTELMVAKAQGDATCASLLSEQIVSSIANPAAQPLRPSGLVSKTSMQIGPENLTATPGSWRASWLGRRVQIRSNHPIPPDSPTFYYEVTILENGHLGYVHTQCHGNSYLVINTPLVSSVLAYADQKQTTLACQAGKQLPGATLATTEKDSTTEDKV